MKGWSVKGWCVEEWCVEGGMVCGGMVVEGWCVEGWLWRDCCGGMVHVWGHGGPSDVGWCVVSLMSNYMH